MRNLTVTLQTTPGTPMPAATPPYAAQAGFRITVTSPSGARTPTAVEQKTVWSFTGLEEGSVYRLLVEAIDSTGRVIQALPEQPITVPAAVTFERLDGFTLAWS